MSSLNKVQLIGRLGKDVDTRYMPNGECVANFSVATSEKWKDKQTGESKEQTEWHNVVAFRKTAEVCAQYLKKGMLIYCEGKLKTEKYTDKHGIEKYTTKIVIEVMQMLTPKNGDGGQNAPQVFSAPQPMQNLYWETIYFWPHIPF